MTTKTMSTYRLTPFAKQAACLLSDKLGLSQTAVVEQALRAMAKKEKIVVAPEGRENDPVYLMTRPRAERHAALAAGAEAVAHFYAEDLAKPIEERELTASTALEGEPILEDYFEVDAHAS